MEKLDAYCISNEHPASRSAENTVDEELLKDDFNFNDKFQCEEACLCFHDQDYFQKIKEFHFYLDMVRKIVKPGCSKEVLKVALTSLSSLVEMLSMMSSDPYPLASL